MCSDSAEGVVCHCDEGFVGGRCEGRGEDFYARTLLLPGIADPDIYKEHDDLFFLTGTGNTVTLPIFASTDLETFVEKRIYDPSASDPNHDYCFVWAPDLAFYEGAYHLHFSAHQVGKGAACPPGAGQEVTTFHAAAGSLELEFGAPELIHDGTGLPRSRVASGCPQEGCSRAIRIDSAVVTEGAERWLFYVWFQGGNNIAGFRASAPETVRINAGPAAFALAGYEEKINEAPEVLARAGGYHLFFSTGFFDSQYAMFHVRADTVEDLTRARAVRRHSMPVRSGGGVLVETHGHNSVVERRGEFFNVFHVGSFDGGGGLTDRSTYKQRLAFRGDGTLLGLNYVDLRWSGRAGYSYSLDVVKRDGTVLGPCIAAARLGAATSTRYTGICPDSGDVRVAKGDIAAFRLYYSNSGVFSDYVEVPFDGAEDRAFLQIPGGVTSAVEVAWNERATGTRYSLDVRRADDSWVAPCAGDAVLGSGVAYVFTGQCPTAGVGVALTEVKELRVCSAVNDDWAHAACGSAAYDGVQGFVDVAIP